MFFFDFQVCLFNPKKSEFDDYIAYVLPFAVRVMKASTELIDYCTDIEATISKLYPNLPIRENLVKIFRSIGDLLPPLFASLWAMELDPKIASLGLPLLSKLLASFSSFVGPLESVKKAEMDFVAGKCEKISVDRTLELERYVLKIFMGFSTNITAFALFGMERASRLASG